MSASCYERSGKPEEFIVSVVALRTKLSSLPLQGKSMMLMSDSD